MPRTRTKRGPQADEPASSEKAKEAIGDSRGGPTTKIHLLADCQCRPLAFLLSQGQRHDSQFLARILDAVRVPRGGRGRPRKRPDDLYLDKGYSYPQCRALLRQRGIRHLIPERRDQRANRQKKGGKGGRPCVYERARYALRNVAERCILRLQWFRRVATRYDKRAETYQAFVTIAAIMLWLR